MSHKESFFIHFAVAAIVIPLAWIAVYFFWPVSPIITWTDGGFKPPKADAGDMVMIHRQFRIHYPGTLHVSRMLVKQNGRGLITISLPDVVHGYGEGLYAQERPFIIPCEVTPGVWGLVNIVTYADRLGRYATLPSPRINLEIERGCVR